MSFGKIYSYPNNPRVEFIQAAAAYGKLKIDLAPTQMGVTNKSPEFLAKFPTGKVPAFEGADGTCIFESDAIAFYVALKANPTQLLGKTEAEQAFVLQWIRFVENHLVSPVSDWIFPIRGIRPYNKVAEKNAQDATRAALQILEQHFHVNTFLIDERITLADLKLASSLKFGYANVLDAAWQKEFPNVLRYFKTVVNHEPVKQIWGSITFIPTALKFQPPKKEEKSKAAAPAKKPAAEPAADDEEEEAPKPRAKNPVDSLPPTPFNLEEWKRQYSNKETLGAGGSIEWFYQNYDPKAYSIWKVDYKYNNELTQVFMSSNLIGGFFNRLEESRKYLFGSLGVYGESNDSVITGAFIARGTGEDKDAEGKVIGAENLFSVAPDYESYAFTKLDLSKEADKKFFENSLAWEGTVEGKKFNDGKVFK